MRKIRPGDRLLNENQTIFQSMGPTHNGAQALSELVRLAST